MLAKNEYSHNNLESKSNSNNPGSKSNSNNPENGNGNDYVVKSRKSRVSLNSLKSFKEDVDLKSN